MKSKSSTAHGGGSPSLPVRGAWIEIVGGIAYYVMSKSLPVRGAWIEMPFRRLVRPPRGSLPVRGAWIEICSRPRAARR